MSELVTSIARGRPAAADRGPPAGRRPVRAGHGGAALARLPAGGPRARSPPSCARPATTPCSATRCWRTCTARSSTRWRRRPPTASCWRTSAAPTTSWPAGSVAPARRSATRCGCSSSRRPCSAGSPPACCPPGTPARCSRSRTPRLQDRLAARVVSEGISVRGLEEIVAVGDVGYAARPAAAQQAGRSGSGRHRRAALGPARDPGEGRPGQVQGQDHRRVRARCRTCSGSWT